MGRLRFSTILIGINVGILLLAMAGVAVASSSLLQQLASEHGLAEVTLAGRFAQREIMRAGADTVVLAQLLAQRPTLLRLLREDDRPALQGFLEQYRQTGGLDSCVLIRDGQVLSAAGRSPFLQADDSPPATPTYVIAQLGTSHALALSARARVLDGEATYVLVTRHLDGPLVSRVSDDIGLPVRVASAHVAGDAVQLAALYTQATRTGTLVASYLADENAYIAVYALRGPGGEPVGFVDVTMPAAGAMERLQLLIRSLVVLVVAVALVAALGSLLVGRWLVRPLAVLSAAATRIGFGDLTTPIPTTPGESRTLAIRLDAMRQSLMLLTADLRRQKADAYAIIAGISEGVFTVDRERRVRYISPQAMTLLGLRPDQALGRFCGDVLNPQGMGGARPCAEHCPIVHARFRNGARATEHLLLADGSRKTVVITSAGPSETQQVQVLRDETELEAVRRMRDTVLANISHEFRTPLSAQLASIELLLDQLPTLSQTQIAELIRAQQRGTLRLTQLIDNLLESVRIEAGQRSIRYQAVALDEAVEAALEVMLPLLQQRRQEVMLTLPYPLPLVRGDAPRLTQVFVNLLANANKFAPEGSAIEVGGDVQQHAVTIWVEDRGPGLPNLPHRALFSQFVRSAAEEPEQSGIGLGLAIVESIVERHGGHVLAQSTGAGTRMSVVLRREDGDEDTGSR